ncbi:MAG: PAS domain S-box protein [Alphaproteobacteria bacterium]|nr:PAS domain S-box protein [Alphaproteobacteria bacterium]
MSQPLLEASGIEILKGIIDFAREPVALVDEHAALVFFNPRFSSLVRARCGIEVSPGDDFAVIYDSQPDGGALFSEHFRKTMMQASDAPMVWPAPAGQWEGAVDLHVRPVRGDGGGVLGAVLIAFDSPGRFGLRSPGDRPFSSLREGQAQRLQRVIFEAMDVGTYEIDLATRQAHLDLRQAELFGFGPTAETVPVRKIVERVYPEDRVIYRGRPPLRDRGSYHISYRVVLPCGTVRWLDEKGRYFFNEEGEAFSLSAITQDVTVQKETEVALRQSEERLRHALKATHGVAYDWEIGSRTVYRPEEALCDLLGYEPNELDESQAWWNNHVHPDDHAALQPDFEAFIKGGKACRESEYRMRRKDGAEIWVRDCHCLVRDAEGRPHRVVGNVTNITHHKQAEFALRQSEERLRLAALATASGVYERDLVNDTEYRSEGAYRILGYSAEEVVGDGWWWSRIHPEDKVGFCSRHADGHVTDSQSEYRILHRNGRFIHIRDARHMIFDENRQLVRIVGTVVDISPEKERQLELWRSNRTLQATLRQLDSLLDNAPVGYAFFDRNFRISKANEFLSRMSGMALSDYEGRTIDELLPCYASDIGRCLSTVFRTERPISEEISGGEPENPEAARCWHCLFYPVFGGNGALCWVGMVAMDITERMEAERIISEREGFLRNILNSLFVLAGVCKPDGTVVEANRAALSIAGIKAKKVIGKKIEETYWWAHDPGIRDRLREAVDAAAAGKVFRFDTAIRVRGGALRPIDFQVVPMRDGQGRITHLIFSGIDIAERERAARLLKESDRRKDEFLATLAHELRNPLAPISNAVQLLEMQHLSDDARSECMSIMKGQLDHMVRLIDDLLDVSRISRGKIVLRKEVVPLRTIIDHAVATNKLMLISRGQSLDVDIRPENPEICCDPTRLSQVVGNLLSNASKYTQEGGHVWIRAWCEGDQVFITVRDDGIGIPKESLGGIFDMFYQVPGREEGGQKGLGIGLKLVRELVELHGGSVRVHSEGEGRGTAFEIGIPRGVSTTKQTPGNEKDRCEMADGASLRVLVVDDYAEAGRTTARIMELLGHEVRLTHHGVEALAVAETWRPEIVLLDIGLPDINGLDVCRAIRSEQARYGSPFVVAVTGWADLYHQKLADEAGFDCHLIKPVPVARLEEIGKSVASRH